MSKRWQNASFERNMMNSRREQKFDKRYALELFRIAKADFQSASVLSRAANEGRPENIFLLAQQSLEKGLKAVICALGDPVPFTHEIEVLTDRIQNRMEVPFLGKFNELSDFATIRRYIEGREDYSIEETLEVLNVKPLCNTKMPKK